MLNAPNRRIERRYLLIASDPKPEFPPPGNLVQKTPAFITGNDLGDASSAETREPHQPISLQRNAPGRRTADIRVHNITFDGNYRIRKRRNRKPSERSPQHRGRWKYPLDLRLIGRGELVTDESSAAHRSAVVEKQVEARTVGRRSPNRAFAADHERIFLVVPAERDAPMS